MKNLGYVVNDVDSVKSAAALRTLPIPGELLAALRAVRGLPKVYVLQAPRTGSFWPQSTYVRRWRAFAAALYALDPSIEHKVLETRKVKRRDENKKWKEVTETLTGSVLTAHYFRHNYASILYDAGVDVLTAQKLLGHADPATTLRIYTHIKERREQIKGDVVQAAFDHEFASVFKNYTIA